MIPARLGLEAGAHTLDLAIELGIQGVPISAEQLVRDGVDLTLAPLRERGLQVCQIGAFGYNPLNSDIEHQAVQREILEKAIPLASQTDCRYIVINGGNYNPNSFGGVDPRNFGEQALDAVAHELAPLLRLAEDAGVALSIEPYLKTAICSAERFMALHEKVGSPALKVNLDVTSLYDSWDLVDPTAKVERTCRLLADHYGLVHIKEIALTEGFHLHAGLAPLGKGPTDWAQVLRLMAPHLPDDSWVILEHVLSPKEARNSYHLLQTAAQSAGVILSS